MILYCNTQKTKNIFSVHQDVHPYLVQTVSATPSAGNLYPQHHTWHPDRRFFRCTSDYLVTTTTSSSPVLPIYLHPAGIASQPDNTEKGIGFHALFCILTLFLTF